MAWVYLIIAGILEIAWAIGLKYTDGFTKLWPTVITFSCMVVSFFLMSIALKSIPMGTAYAVWTGIGAAGTVIFGMLFLQEPREIARIICLVMVVGGIVGLKAVSPA